MSACLHLATLNQRSFSRHAEPLPTLTRCLDGLDRLAKALGVGNLSQFVDITELELQEAEALLDEAEREEASVDPETGLVCAIEDMQWFPVAAGMITLEALLDHLAHNQPGELKGTDLRQLSAELIYCEQQLRPLEDEGAQFHLHAVSNAQATGSQE